jgi:hypothetical protein
MRHFILLTDTNQIIAQVDGNVHVVPNNHIEVNKSYRGYLGYTYMGDDTEPVDNRSQEELDMVAYNDAKYIRNYLLTTEVDPIVSNPLRWAALTAEQQQAWADYRQALLDVPTQDGFPHDVVWPTKPE